MRARIIMHMRGMYIIISIIITLRSSDIDSADPFFINYFSLLNCYAQYNNKAAVCQFGIIDKMRPVFLALTGYLSHESVRKSAYRSSERSLPGLRGSRGRLMFTPARNLTSQIMNSKTRTGIMQLVTIITASASMKRLRSVFA